MERLIWLVATVTFVHAVNDGTVCAESFAALAPGGVQDDDRLSVIYNALTGEVAVESPIELVSIQIDSESGMFTEDFPSLGGDWEIADPARQLFTARFQDTMTSWSFGTPAQRGLSEEFVFSDLSVLIGAAGGTAITEADLIYIPVPEPPAFLLLSVGVVAVLSRRHQHWPAAGYRR